MGGTAGRGSSSAGAPLRRVVAAVGLEPLDLGAGPELFWPDALFCGRSTLRMQVCDREELAFGAAGEHPDH